MTKTRKKKVFWNPQEEHLITTQVVELLTQFDHIKLLDAIRQAQDEVLPTERKRDIKTVKNAPQSLLLMIATAQKNKAAATIEKAEPLLEDLTVASITTPERARVIAADNLARSTTSPAPTTTKTWEVLLRDFLIDVVVGATRRILEDPLTRELANDFWAGVAKREVTASFVPPELRGYGTPGAGKSAKHNPEGEVAEPKRVRVRKVLIVGLKPPQRPNLESAFNGRLLLKFWLDESTQLLQSKAASVDHVICTMGASSHKAMDSLAAAGVKHPVRVNGGGSSIEAALNEIVKLGTIPINGD